MVLCHLPDGPTAHFKISSVRLRKEMKVSTEIHTLIHFINYSGLINLKNGNKVKLNVHYICL